jgi:hypothetical protein
MLAKLARSWSGSAATNRRTICRTYGFTFVADAMLKLSIKILLQVKGLGVHRLHGLTAGPQFIEGDGQDNDGSFDHQLPIEGDIHQSQPVIEYDNN